MQTVIQRLNLHGAFLIEQGEYGKAMKVLVKALRLWNTLEDKEHPTCCSIDECIMLGSHHYNKSPQALNYRNNRCLRSIKTSSDDAGATKDGFIYQQPIIATRVCLPDKEENSAPGGTLPLILSLNLAMANQLSALENNLCRRRLQKSLKWYGFAHQIQKKSNICSPQSTMIISNNVGEIHRITNNRTKHFMCLNHLLSTMMYVIDAQHEESPSSTQTRIELDGFLRNTSKLILRDGCAGAA